MSIRLLIFMGVVLAVSLWWALRVQRAERRRLRELAARLGAEYSARDRLDLRRRYHELALWQYGHAHEPSRLLRGKAGLSEFVAACDCFDVGFGRDRRRSTHLLVIVKVEQVLPNTVFLRDAVFEPLGPHTGYLPVEDGAPADWQTYNETGEAPARLWPILQAATAELSGPTLVELRRRLIAVCQPASPEPERYERLIRAGTELARQLGAESRDAESARA